MKAKKCSCASFNFLFFQGTNNLLPSKSFWTGWEFDVYFFRPIRFEAILMPWIIEQMYLGTEFVVWPVPLGDMPLAEFGIGSLFNVPFSNLQVNYIIYQDMSLIIAHPTFIGIRLAKTKILYLRLLVVAHFACIGCILDRNETLKGWGHRIRMRHVTYMARIFPHMATYVKNAGLSTLDAPY